MCVCEKIRKEMLKNALFSCISDSKEALLSD